MTLQPISERFPITVLEPYRFEKGFIPFRGLRATEIQTDIATAGSTASTVGGAIGTIVGGPLLGAAVSAAIQGAAALASAIAGVFSGCGQTCVEASNVANQVGNLLSQNVHNYINAPIRTQSMQAAFLATFDNAWAQLVQMCSNPQLGTAGQNCISDRQQGACTWKSSPGGWQQDASGNWSFIWPGPAGSGTACWNYFVGMRDPIANDPTVVPDSVLQASGVTVSPSGQVMSVSDANGNTTPVAAVSGSSSMLPILLIGGIILALVVMK